MADQPIRTATGQEYGQVQQQQESQRAIPLPKMRPGDQGGLLRGSERPNESIMQPPGSKVAIPAQKVGSSDYNRKLAVMMPYLLEEASKPTASPQTRFIVNQLSLMVAPLEDS